MPLENEFDVPNFSPPTPSLNAGKWHQRTACIYSLIPGFRGLELDFYEPLQHVSSPRTVVMWIHGGGYHSGGRAQFAPWLQHANMIGQVLAAGMCFVSLDYRLGREANFPAAIVDARAALRYLRRYATVFNIDPERIVLWGESAGGHLAAMTAYCSAADLRSWGVDEKLYGSTSTEARVIGLVDWYGASDLPTIVRPMDGSDTSLPDEQRFPPEYFNLGADRWLDIGARVSASPTTYVRPDCVPTLLIHGDQDSIVPFQQSEILLEKLDECDVSANLLRIAGAEHAWIGSPLEVVDHVIKQSVEFSIKISNAQPL